MQLRAYEAENSKNHLAILCLIVLCSNLTSNLTHRDPHPKNANLKFAARQRYRTCLTLTLTSLRSLPSLYRA
ncbi:hypothetical protein CAMRE0001_1991 [Campylobacter rectus RM3267]|uniref:Uncharacterized protein n=1 Tax=Campylobacter rectus RM3267 TaxID=553218 RepID=B9D3B5_CAMRE|nr:hypothetical protein CAMRE0001_1991 [Campylobacter rectus RM3267]